MLAEKSLSWSSTTQWSQNMQCLVRCIFTFIIFKVKKGRHIFHPSTFHYLDGILANHGREFSMYLYDKDFCITKPSSLFITLLLQCNRRKKKQQQETRLPVPYSVVPKPLFAKGENCLINCIYSFDSNTWKSL